MQPSEIIVPAVGLLVGGAIGAGFGLLHNIARDRNQRQETEGNLKNAWRLMPGSGGRVAMLLVVLALVQIVCPMLFAPETQAQWWVMGGIAAGTGAMLMRRFRQIRSRTM